MGGLNRDMILVEQQVQIQQPQAVLQMDHSIMREWQGAKCNFLQGRKLPQTGHCRQEKAQCTNWFRQTSTGKWKPSREKEYHGDDHFGVGFVRQWVSAGNGGEASSDVGNEVQEKEGTWFTGVGATKVSNICHMREKNRFLETLQNYVYIEVIDC